MPFSNMFQALESVDKDTPEPQTCELKGQVPAWVEGSLIRVGPGRFKVGPDEMKHLFDGLAVIHRYCIKDGKVTYQNQFIKSNDLERCQKADRIVATQFGTQAYPDPCKSIFNRHFSYYFLENQMPDNTNVNVMQMGDELYAMTETHILNKIDPQSLDTIGNVDVSKVVSVHGVTAHPHQDPDGTTYNLASSYGRVCRYHVVKYPPPVPGDVDHPNKISIVATMQAYHGGNPSYSHSFSLTENFFVQIEQPLLLTAIKMPFGRFTNVAFKDALNFRPNEKARFRLIDKRTGVIHPVSYTAAAFFTFHTINAYEEAGHVVMDVTAYDNADIIDQLSLASLRGEKWSLPFNTRRFVFPLYPNLNAKAHENLVDLEDCAATAAYHAKDKTVFLTPQVYDIGAELPRINYDFNGRKYRYFYGLNFRDGDDVPEELKGMMQLVKFDLEVQTKYMWENDDRDLEPGEPVFIKSPQGEEEDDGVILCPVISNKPEKSSFLLILDAASFKEVGRAEIPVKVPYTFHGLFYKT